MDFRIWIWIWSKGQFLDIYPDPISFLAKGYISRSNIQHLDIYPGYISFGSISYPSLMIWIYIHLTDRIYDMDIYPKLAIFIISKSISKIYPKSESDKLFFCQPIFFRPSGVRNMKPDHKHFEFLPCMFTACLNI